MLDNVNINHMTISSDKILSLSEADFAAHQKLEEGLLHSMRRTYMDGSELAPPASETSTKSLMPAKSFLSRLLGLRPMLEIYETFPATQSALGFCEQTLQVLGIQTINEGEKLADLPKEGPTLFFANHPFGGIEGVIMAARCLSLRPDFKLLANQMLAKIPELAPIIIPINVTAKSQKENLSSIRAGIRHLESGGSLGIFPSGVVAHFSLAHRKIVEPIWYSLCGRLARIPEVQAIPIYFKGNNSKLFHAAGCIHPALRTFLLPRELWGMRGRTLRFVVGKAVDTKLLASLCDDNARTAHLRARCEHLGKQIDKLPSMWPVPIAAQSDVKTLQAEVKELLQKDTLAAEGRYAVFAISGNQSPKILDEIGRLREETFREVGEGSGQERDLDQFDPSYHHLVLWDVEKEQMAGGYRVRCFKPEEAKDCQEKLYTASLFRFEPDFFAACKNSMELGRAFVATEYQRDYVPLLLLWKGIGRMIVRNNLRTLFGPCSMGLGYAEGSVHMLRQYLQENHWDEKLSLLAKGLREPSSIVGPNAINVHGLDFKGCNRAVKDLEGDKGLPILFKHYLQLNGRIAAFHEDMDFGTLDALLVVDLAETPKKTLLRYMSEEELQTLYENYRA